MKITILFFAILILSGCDKNEFNPQYTPIIDQCIRMELFASCMASLPEGPSTTKYNDWDEVVDSCSSAAVYQSYRPRKYVPEQCRFGN